MADGLNLEILPENQLKLFNDLADYTWVSDFYLAGGTALALQLGHRQSIDFDFFTKKKLNNEALKKNLNSLGSFELFSEDKNTLNAGVNTIRVSFFEYDVPLLNDLLRINNIFVASLLDIALMKFVAISGRGSKKDFIDLFFLLKYFNLQDLFKDFGKKFGPESANSYHLLKSLVYFEDAENQPSPVMLKEVAWSEVKESIQEIVKQYHRNI